MKKILALILAYFFISIANFAHAKTLAELRTELRRAINDTYTSRARYTDEFLNDYLNEAQNAIVGATWLSLRTTSYSLSRGTTFYSLPEDYLATNYVEFKDARNDARILKEVTLKGLGSSNSNWAKDSGIPNQYYVDLATSSTQPAVAFIPIPGTASSTGTVNYWYFAKVSTMSSDTDVPFNGRSNLSFYHIGLVYHAAMRIKALEKKPNDVTFFSQLFVQIITELKERLGTMPNYKPSIGVGG